MYNDKCEMGSVNSEMLNEKYQMENVQPGWATLRPVALFCPDDVRHQIQSPARF